MIKNCRLCCHYQHLEGECHMIAGYDFLLHNFYCKRWNDTYHFYNPCPKFKPKK